MDETLSQLVDMMERTKVLIEQLTTDDHNRKTPCADYTVAQLAEHVAVWIQVFDAAVNDEPLSFDPTTERIESGWEDVIARSGSSILEGLRSKGVDRQMTMTGSPLPGVFVLNMLLMEYIGHGWDIARALGRPAPFDDEQALVALTAAEAIIQPQHRGDEGMFGDAVVVPDDAPPLDRFVAFIGRDPNWRCS